MAKKPGRIGEADIGPHVLDIIGRQPGQQITTTKLIEELRKVVRLSPEDEEQLDGRQDDRFSQIVRNIKSHKKTPGNLICDGRLIEIRGGFRLP